jgi:hypothetical protein
MKITIELECRIDGPAPSDADVMDAVMAKIPGVLMSEDIGKPDEWAVLVNAISVEVSP